MFDIIGTLHLIFWLNKAIKSVILLWCPALTAYENSHEVKHVSQGKWVVF